MEITGINNPLVKDTVKLQQKKYRQISGKFLIEGYKCIYEGINSGINFEYIFVLSDKKDKYNFIKEKIITTTPAILKKISTTDTYPEAVGVAFQKKCNLTELKKSKKVILLENISDAGNLGTIIRSAAAFEIDSIILYGDTVDIYNPKCVRSAVGNLWKTNIYTIKELEDLNKYFDNYERIATVPKSTNSIWFKDWQPKEKTVIMFGSEADGLSKELLSWANKNLTIEMSKSVESLNLSISASLLMCKLFIEKF